MAGLLVAGLLSLGNCPIRNGLLYAENCEGKYLESRSETCIMLGISPNHLRGTFKVSNIHT